MPMSTFAGGMRSAAEGLALAALVDSYLERRFYSWVGLSGARYICTVFGAGDAEAISSFTGAAIIGVAHNDGVRRPVCVLDPSDFAATSQAQVIAAVALAVNEWHVHFSSSQRKLAADLGCQ